MADEKMLAALAMEHSGLSAMGKHCVRRMYSKDEQRTLIEWQKQWMKDGIADFDLKVEKAPEPVTEVRKQEERKSI